MDFSALPPEINSARMYSGPGSVSMLTAAGAWEQVAADMYSSADAYQSVITKLVTDHWQGPSAMAMATAAAVYVRWMHVTASQAEQTASQVKATATAYQSAFALTVPPPLIAANRSRLLALIATNFFGQNSPAIAITEAEYEQMWAQDAAAMHGYAVSTAATSKLAPFTQPPAVTQVPAALAAAASTPTAQAVLYPNLTNAIIISMLLTLAGPLQAIPIFSGSASITSASLSGSSIQATNFALMVNAMRDEVNGIGPFVPEFILPIVTSPISAGLASAPISAAMGRASLVNTLSVPQAWAATTTPPISLEGSPMLTAGDAAPVPASFPPGVFGETMLGTLAGRGVSNAAAKARRSSVIPRSPAAG